MSRIYESLGLISLVLAMNGCVTRGPGMAERMETREQAVSKEQEHAMTGRMDTALSHAQQLEAQGQFKQAMEEYAMVQSVAERQEQEEPARLGRARCMLGMNRPDAAIALLSDLPEEPVTPLEAQQMALVGEAFLRKGRFVQAESLFEVALSVPLVEKESWTPPVCANLAVAYLQNDKPDKAYAMYDYAAKLFRQREKYESSTVCRKMATMLIRQDGQPGYRSSSRPKNISLKTGI